MHTLKGRLIPYGEEYILPVSAEDVERLGLKVGQTVLIRIEKT